MTNLQKYNQAFTSVLGVKEEALNVAFTFKDVPQWDSVAHLSLITALEEAFDVFFESNDILHYESYENGKRILKKYGVTI